MNNLTRAFLISLLLAGCAVRLEQCRPSFSIDRMDDTCQFNIHRPAECIAVLWMKVKCPTENLK